MIADWTIPLSYDEDIKLNPCQCGNKDVGLHLCVKANRFPSNERLQPMVVVMCPVCKRQTKPYTKAKYAKHMWNLGKTIEPKTQKC